MRIRQAAAADAPVLIEFNCAMALETERKELLPEVIGAGVRALLANPAAGFYVVAAWALLQAADVLGPDLGFPEGTVGVLFWVALAGLVLTIALAWYFERTPEGIRRDPADLRLRLVPQAPKPPGFLFQARQRQLGRGAEACNARHVLGAGPEALLLATATDQLLGDLELVGGENHGSDSLRPADLVGGERQDVDAEPGHVDRDLPGRLHGVRMDQAAMFVHEPGRLGHRLQYAGLVVGKLNG